MSDAEGERVRERIHLDVERGKSLNVRGTPTVFINGEMISHELTADFGQVIEEVLNRAKP